MLENEELDETNKVKTELRLKPHKYVQLLAVLKLFGIFLRQMAAEFSMVKN